MSETATIAQWGNSKAVRIPATTLRAAQLGLHDRVIFTVVEDGLLLRKDLSLAKTWRDFFGTINNREEETLLDALRDCERIDDEEW